MTTLRKAHDDGKIDQFVKEHADDPKGDADAFNRALQSMAGKSKPAPETSKPDRSDD